MKLIRLSLLVLVAGSVVAMPSAAKAQWVAYNDFSWVHTSNLIFGAQGATEKDVDYRTTPGDINSGLAKVTLFTNGNTQDGGITNRVDTTDFYAPDLAIEAPEPNGEQARSGFLRNYNTGATLGAGVSVGHTGTTFNWGTQQGAPFAEAPGHDAYDSFWDANTGEPIISLWGMADGDDVNSVHTVTLSNLDPNKTYEYTTTGNFGGWGGSSGGVQWRWTKIEGHDASGFQNLSSVDTDYATAVNVLVPGDPADPRNSVGHEQRAVIRSDSDPSHYVQNSGEIWFDGWVTKFQFKPGLDGTVDIVTKGINNAASMEEVFVDDEGFGFSTDSAGVPIWSAASTAVDPVDPTIHTAHSLTRDVANLKNGGQANPAHPFFQRHYGSGWREHSDPAQWPADPDALELTVGQSKDAGDVANSRWSLSGFKLEELAAVALLGDFNNDGTVDAADYTEWLDNLGDAAGLPNDNSLGAVGQSHYDLWKANFGNTSGTGTTSGDAVPEPSTLLLVFSALLSFGLLRRRKA